MEFYGQKAIEKILEHLAEFGISLFWAAVIVFVGLRLSKWLVKTVKAVLERSKIDDGVCSFLVSIIKIGSQVIVLLSAATHLGFDKTAIVTLLGSAGVAVGLALQGSLSNIAGGCLILLLKPFKVGDYIKEDSHGNEGTVLAIDLFYTRIQTIDSKVVVIPNGVITNSSLTNVTRQEQRLLDMRFSISYEDDIVKAKEIIRRVAENHAETLNEENILVFVDQLGDSAIILGLRVEVPTENYNPIRWDINEKVKLAFDENGISIPYNQLDVRVVHER